MDRRSFLSLTAAGLAVPHGLAGLVSRHARQEPRYPLGVPPRVSAQGLTLTASPSTVDVGPGSVEAFTLNGTMPSPTIVARQGDTVTIDLVNRLPQPTILHWHGLAVPVESDGHPRLAIDPGETYSYEYRVLNRPGTYWYHPHTHQLTGYQTYKGMGGLLIVEGDADEYDLPTGELDLSVVLQDRLLQGSVSLDYRLRTQHERMHGYLGDTMFGNGVANPTVDVRRSRYRVRILNGSNARILNLGLTNGRPLTVIGGDGGLLGQPLEVDRVLLAPAERAEVLVDFSGYRPGERIMLRSFAFDIPGGMMMGMGMRGGGPGGGGRGGMPGMMGGGGMQGTEMDALEFVVRESSPDPGPALPVRFADVPSRGEVTDDTPRKTFRFQSSPMMRTTHSINGRTFQMLRVDAETRLGETEVWTFVNDSGLPHPVHVHAGQFRVLARRGGRGQVMPWETGLKDTVLIMPGEEVDFVVRFVYPGLYLIHCHNLEHEDMGMMLNFEVVE